MNRTLVPVLLYHSVADEQSSWGAVSRAEFRSHIDAIRASGRTAVTVTMLAQALRGERALADRAVAITFDDGYADTYEAVELLREHGLCATVYVTTGGIGTPGWLSRQQISALHEMGHVELGAHGIRHVHLDELGHRELEEEIQLSKAQLEDLTGGCVESFAYPHGAYDRRVRGHVLAAGYSSAAAVKNAICHLADDPFAIARCTVTGGTPAARVAEILDGNNVPLAWRGERLRTRAYRTARRSRRRLFGTGTAAC